jgi:hypothetical protein
MLPFINLPRRHRNLVRDKDRLRKVYELLVQTPGNDQFSFYIPDGQRKIRVDFPNQTTRDTVHLRQLLYTCLNPNKQKPTKEVGPGCALPTVTAN